MALFIHKNCNLYQHSQMISHALDITWHYYIYIYPYDAYDYRYPTRYPYDYIYVIHTIYIYIYTQHLDATHTTTSPCRDGEACARIVTACADHQVRIWDSKSLQCLHVFGALVFTWKTPGWWEMLGKEQSFISTSLRVTKNIYKYNFLLEAMVYADRVLLWHMGIYYRYRNTRR